jgi:hypothetical protein
MATTTNYGWTTPDDTALVKDGAAAIRTLGSSVDTTTKNLNPETTLGDIAYRSSTANVKTRLALGTANQVLAVNSGATAPEWKTIGSGGLTLIGTPTTFGTVASQSISDVFSSTYDNYRIIIQHGGSSASNFVGLRFRVSGADNTSTNYRWAALGALTYESASVLLSDGGATATNCLVTFGNSGYGGNSTIDIQNPFATANTTFNGTFAATGIGASASTFGLFNATTSFTGFTISPFGGGNLTGGTITVYGYNK